MLSAVLSTCLLVQYREDLGKDEGKRCWLRCDIGTDGDNIVIILATPSMMAAAWEFGQNKPLYMDATHGLQKYGLKLVTIHVKDLQARGTF